MRETSIMDNLNYETQAHAKVCEENKIEQENKMMLSEIILQSKV